MNSAEAPLVDKKKSVTSTIEKVSRYSIKSPIKISLSLSLSLFRVFRARDEDEEEEHFFCDFVVFA